MTAGEDLSPPLRERVQALIQDLARSDAPMALLDLAHIYRVLADGPRSASGGDQRVDMHLNEDGPALIHTRDGTAIEEICDGPDQSGRCPRAKSDQSVACAGKFITANGWRFVVADDFQGCPLVALQAARRYLQATIAQEPRSQGKV